jgi:hypothetical protein
MEEGRYACYLQGKRILTCDEVGVLLDQDTGSVLKHGQPEEVESHFHILHRAFQAGGFEKEANDLVFMKGRFETEDLNSMVGICGFAGQFYRRKVADAVPAGESHVTTC